MGNGSFPLKAHEYFRELNQGLVFGCARWRNLLGFSYMDQFTYRIIIEPDGKGFHAYVPALPGCHSCGDTIFDARKHIREALELYLECLAEDGDPIPKDESFETFHTVGIPRRAGRRTKSRTRQYA